MQEYLNFSSTDYLTVMMDEFKNKDNRTDKIQEIIISPPKSDVKTSEAKLNSEDDIVCSIQYNERNNRIFNESENK